MATEYKLSYTGSQINERLGMVDELNERIKAIDDIELALENKQDALSFDSTPTEGSENPITSGGVYEALQNIDVGSGGGEGGNVALAAGDLLEIKDGVIRSTLGDDTGEVVEVFNELYNIQIQDLSYEEDMGFYVMEPQDLVDTIPKIGDSLDIYFTPADENTPIHYNTTVVDFQEIPTAFCNATLSENFEFAAIDESLPAFMLIFVDDDEEKYIPMYLCGDYTGATVSVGTLITEHKYITLPDNALIAGDLIEIKDGVVSSTLGKTYTRVEYAALFDSDILELVESEIDEEDPAWSAYYYQDIYQDTFLDKPENEEEPIDIEVKYYPSESDDFVILKGLYAYSYDSKDDCDNYYMYVNAKMGEDDVEVDNPNFPIIQIGADKYSSEDEFEIYLTSYGQDITGARIVIDGERVTKTTIKLPNTALNMDFDRISGDPNKVVSSYAVEEAIENTINYFNNDLNAIRNTIDKNTSPLVKGLDGGLSANPKAVPTGDNSWIEGQAAPSTHINTSSHGVTQIYLSVVKETVNKSTVTNAYINIICNDEPSRTTILNEIGASALVSLVFVDTPNETYWVCPLSASVENTNIKFKFSFKRNTFPVDTEIASRNIQQLTILPKCGTASHAEGYATTASGNYSHAEGYCTKANAEYSHVQGKFNIVDNGINTNYTYAHIVGNGTSEENRSNAHTLDWNGNAWFAGKVYVGGTSMDDATELGAGGDIDLSGYYTKTEVDALIPDVGDFITEIPAEYVTETELNAKGYLTNESIGHGNLIGKTGSTQIDKNGIIYTISGAEIFNDYANNIASGDYSHAEGKTTTASGQHSHAEGWETVASGQDSHAEGQITTASGFCSHTEGAHTIASGENSHAEGCYTTASGNYSHAEGQRTTASGRHSHVQGKYNIADTVDEYGEGKYAHIVGNGYSEENRSNAHTLDWNGNAWFAGKVYVGGTSMDDATELGAGGDIDLSGYYTKTEVDALIPDVGDFITDESIGHGNLIGKTGATHKEDAPNVVVQHAEIFNDYTNNIASADFTHAEGSETTASGRYSHAEGYKTTASGDFSHAEGNTTTASAWASHAEGSSTKANGNYSHAEGSSTQANGNYSHTEGNGVTANGANSHAEGCKTTADKESSHAEGYETTASGDYSHAEGWRTTASGTDSHAEGEDTIASGQGAHAEGSCTTASGYGSHAEGAHTIASGDFSHVQGKCNIEDTENKYAHIVGNGIGSLIRSNAYTLDWDGNGWFAGTVEATAIILSSPNGTRFKITVDDSGTLSAAQVES